jgi:hypothetical protein
MDKELGDTVATSSRGCRKQKQQQHQHDFCPVSGVDKAIQNRPMTGGMQYRA